jgi:hypothetical protein
VSRLFKCYAECRYAECRYAKCRYAEWNYAECHYTECRYAECRDAECRYAECRSAPKLSFVHNLKPFLNITPKCILNTSFFCNLRMGPICCSVCLLQGNLPKLVRL